MIFDGRLPVGERINAIVVSTSSTARSTAAATGSAGGSNAKAGSDDSRYTTISGSGPADDGSTRHLDNSCGWG